MALKERGQLTRDQQDTRWQIQHDEGTIDLTDELVKTINAEARRKKKSRASIESKLQDELVKHVNKHVEIELGDNGDFRVEALKLEAA